MKKVIFILLSVICILQASAQKQANNWIFRDVELNFNNHPVSTSQVSAPHLLSGMGVISDSDGMLLFYTDGFSVWNKNHQLMPNGSNLVSSNPVDYAFTSIVIPKPGDASTFYIFTNDRFSGGLYYSEVNINLAGGLGDVTTKGVKLINSSLVGITATFHENRKDVWLATLKENTNKYQILQITETGITTPITEQEIGPSQGIGQLKFSPDGKKAAIAANGISLFDFNTATGVFSNAMHFPFSNPWFVGLEFSSDATKLYATGYNTGLIRYDVSLPTMEEIAASKERKDVVNNGNDWLHMQVAPDGKIYSTKGGGGGGTGHLGAVVNPNATFSELFPTGEGLFLEGGDVFVNSTPNFIQDYFFKTYFTYTHPCQANDVSFQITNEHLLDSAKWYFGEGSSSKNRNPQFSYSTPGDYTVKLVAYYGERADTITQTITVDPVSPVSLGEDRAVCRNSELTVAQDFPAFEWNTGDTTQTITIHESGWYAVKITNALNCFSVDSVFLTVNDLPQIDLPDTLTWGGTPVQLTTGPFNSYEWSTGESTSSIMVNTTGWYSVSVQNDVGCRAAKSVYVTDHKEEETEEEWTWTRISPKPSGDPGRDIYFINREIGFIINDHHILRTQDGGTTWKIQQSITSGNRIKFKDQIGYIVGNQGTIYKSTHLGDGWNKLNFISTENLNSVTVLHPDTVYVTSDNKLFITHDGGKSWIERTVGADIEDAFFTSKSTGHVACTGGIIRKTTDAGVTWRVTESVNFTPANFFRITFVNKDIGFATREFSDVFRTTDGGESWSEVANLDAGYGIQFINEHVGFIAGEHGAMWKTTDSGITWTWIGFAPRIDLNHLYSIFFIDENVGYSTGFRGRIIKTINGGVTWQGHAPTYDNIDQLDWANEEDGFILVGNSIFSTPDQGNTWIPRGAPVSGLKTPDIDFVNENLGFAVVGGSLNSTGSSTQVFKTTNGGVNWSKAHASAQLTSDGLDFIHFINENVGFVSGGPNNPVLLRTSNGGQNWTQVMTALIGQLQFVTDQIGFACTKLYLTNKVFKTTNGGLSWQQLYSLENNTINAMSFVDQQIGFLSTGSGTVLKTTNGGSSWSLMTTVPPGFYVSIKFYSPLLGYILNEDGDVLVTRNGGISWDLDLHVYGLRSLEKFGESIYAAGNFGTVFQKTIGTNDFVSLRATTESVSDTHATLECTVSSSLNLANVPLTLEIGETKNNYTQKIPVTTLNGFVNSTYRGTLQNLTPEKVYFYRYVATLGDDSIAVSAPQKFITEQLITAVDPREELKLDVYPNPAKDFIIIRISESFQYSIYDLTGRTQLTGTSDVNEPINVAGLTRGVYIINIRTATQNILHKIIKE